MKFILDNNDINTFFEAGLNAICKKEIDPSTMVISLKILRNEGGNGAEVEAQFKPEPGEEANKPTPVEANKPTDGNTSSGTDDTAETTDTDSDDGTGNEADAEKEESKSGTIFG